MKPIKLVSLNVALFETNNALLDAFLSSENAQFVCLQEVSRAVKKGVNPDYISFDSIDRATNKLEFGFYGPTTVVSGMRTTNFHGKELFDIQFGGLLEFGMYTKSEYPIVKGQNVFVQNSYTYATSHEHWPEVDFKSVLVTDHMVNGKPLRILNYHGIWTQHKMGNELALAANAKIYELAKQAQGEVVICGDFNLFPDTPAMRIFDEGFVNQCNVHNIRTTRPSTNELHSKKRNVVDYVFTSKGIKVTDFRVEETNVSDHLPLILEFNL